MVVPWWRSEDRYSCHKLAREKPCGTARVSLFFFSPSLLLIFSHVSLSLFSLAIFRQKLLPIITANR